MVDRSSKLVALVLMAVVVAAGAGYWFLTPKMPNELVSTVQETSLLTPLERSQTSTESTILASATTVASATTAWINVNATSPMNYYLSLLESNGSQPYVQLAKELRKLPDLKNATAVAKITYLALNAKNPEVKEAFELMMKAGTPSPSDFTSAVPNYNTELQVLYWLACQNEFKKDDTLALSIAAVHGLWVTMGNEQVKQAVRNDSTQLLRYFREINELQRAQGYFRLEDYPLEAKLSLAWTGGATPAWGEYGLSDKLWSGGYTTKKLDLEAYRWDAVNVTTLTRMRGIIEKNGWSSADVNLVVANLEHYFYFTNTRKYLDTWRSDHWIYSRLHMYDIEIEIGGGKHRSFFLLTPNYQFDFYLRNGYVTGNCVDETVFIEAWAKSWGIATTGLISTTTDDEHMYSIYYDPATRSWRAYSGQLAWYLSSPGAGNLIMLRVFKPSVQQRGYLRIYEIPIQDYTNFGGGMFTVFKGVYTLDSVRETFSKGLPTSEMKEWLLYS